MSGCAPVRFTRRGEYQIAHRTGEGPVSAPAITPRLRHPALPEDEIPGATAVRALGFGRLRRCNCSRDGRLRRATLGGRWQRLVGRHPRPTCAKVLGLDDPGPADRRRGQRGAQGRALPVGQPPIPMWTVGSERQRGCLAQHRPDTGTSHRGARQCFFLGWHHPASGCSSERDYLDAGKNPCRTPVDRVAARLYFSPLTDTGPGGGIGRRAGFQVASVSERSWRFRVLSWAPFFCPPSAAARRKGQPPWTIPSLPERSDPTISTCGPSVADPTAETMGLKPARDRLCGVQLLVGRRAMPISCRSPRVSGRRTSPAC